MAAIPNISLDNVAYAITNPATGKAIDRRTLERHFSKELELSKGWIQDITMKSWIEMIQEHSWPAVRAALAAHCNVKADGEVVATVNNTDNKNINWTVNFVEAKKKYDGDGNLLEVPAIPPRPPRLAARVPELEHNGHKTLDMENFVKPLVQEEPTPQPVRPVRDFTPLPAEPIAAPQNAKERRAALSERAAAEGFGEWSDFNPRGSAFDRTRNPNRLWNAKTRSYK
jgi:hypothetical protein